MNKLASMKIEFVVPTPETIPNAVLGRALAKLEGLDLEYRVNHFVRAMLGESQSDDLAGLIVKVRFVD